VVIPVVLAVALVGIGCVLYGILIERRWYRLVRHRLAILPATGPETLSVLHLSDLHFVRDEPRSRAVPGIAASRRRHRRHGGLPRRARGVETVVDMLRPTRRTPGLLVRAGIERLLRAAAPELLRVLPTEPQTS
jgi:hypothetical protein